MIKELLHAKALDRHGFGIAHAFNIGYSKYHSKLEEEISEYLGQEKLYYLVQISANLGVINQLLTEKIILLLINLTMLQLMAQYYREQI